VGIPSQEFSCGGGTDGEEGKWRCISSLLRLSGEEEEGGLRKSVLRFPEDALNADGSALDLEMDRGFLLGLGEADEQGDGMEGTTEEEGCCNGECEGACLGRASVVDLGRLTASTTVLCRC
jgi:hypothetical protein